MCNNYISLAVFAAMAFTSNIYAPRLSTSRRTESPAPAVTPTVSIHSRLSRLKPEEVIRKSTEDARRIFITMFCLTSDKIGKSIKLAADAGTEVTIIFDWNQAKHSSSLIGELATYNPDKIKIFVVSSKTLHSKVMAIEYLNGKTSVLDGSYNYSESAKSHEEILTRNDDPAYYAKTLEMLLLLITNETAKPFDEAALEESKARHAARRSPPTEDTPATTSPDSSAPLFSPPRPPKHTPVKPSPSSLASGPLDPSPIALVRAATLLAQECLEHTLTQHIRTAKTIHIIMYNLSSPRIADELIAAHRAGIEISIIADRLQSCGPSSQIERLRTSGIPVFRNKADMIHCKCFIIETKDGEKLVISGSANASSRVYAGHNIEQSSRLAGDDIYKKFMQLHDTILEAAKPLTTTIELKTPVLAAVCASTESALPPLTPLADSTNKRPVRLFKRGQKNSLSYVQGKPVYLVKDTHDPRKRSKTVGIGGDELII